MALGVGRQRGGTCFADALRPNGLHSCHAMQSVCDFLAFWGLKVFACPDGTEGKGEAKAWGVEVQYPTPP